MSINCRHYRHKKKLASLFWKVDMKDVIIIPTDLAEIENINRNRNMVNVVRESVNVFFCS